MHVVIVCWSYCYAYCCTGTLLLTFLYHTYVHNSTFLYVLHFLVTVPHLLLDVYHFLLDCWSLVFEIPFHSVVVLVFVLKQLLIFSTYISSWLYLTRFLLFKTRSELWYGNIDDVFGVVRKWRWFSFYEMKIAYFWVFIRLPVNMMNNLYPRIFPTGTSWKMKQLDTLAEQFTIQQVDGIIAPQNGIS